MEHMRQIAYETVLRACGFASLAIFCVMIGMSFDPRLAFQAGGFLTTIMAFVLILKSREALTKDYRKTEMWLYIDKQFRPPEAYAQWASSTILRDTYLTFAMWTALISISMWVLALFFSLIGTKSTLALDGPPGKPQQSFITPSQIPSADERTVTSIRGSGPSIRYQVFLP
jgi:hypothetical protein